MYFIQQLILDERQILGCLGKVQYQDRKKKQKKGLLLPDSEVFWVLTFSCSQYLLFLYMFYIKLNAPVAIQSFFLNLDCISIVTEWRLRRKRLRKIVAQLKFIKQALSPECFSSYFQMVICFIQTKLIQCK